MTFGLSTVLVGSETVRSSVSGKLSPQWSRESAQGFLDVTNLEPEPVKEVEVEENETEDKMLDVLCRMKKVLGTQLLSHA